MVRQIHNRILVGRRGIFDFEVLADERVPDNRGQISRKALITVRTGIREFDPVRNYFAFPNDLVESFGTAVESIGPVIYGYLIRLAVQLELTAADSVSVPANDRSEISWVRLDVLFSGVEP